MNKEIVVNPLVIPDVPLVKNENIMVMQNASGFLIRYLIPASAGAEHGMWAQGTGITYAAAQADAIKNLKHIING